MQWLQGLSLEELLRQASPLEVPVVLRLGRQIALGLAAAHAQGLLHRDIKPANLWVESVAHASILPSQEESAASEGRIKILVFGLARTIVDEAHQKPSGVIVGPPAYMA